MASHGAAAVLAASLFGVSSDAAAFSVGDSWDWQLTAPVDLKRPVAVMDLHPDLVSKADVEGLKSQGVETVCYVSVGTVEKTSPDKTSFPASIIGRTYEDWPEERFLDIRRFDVLLPLMRRRFERCKALGFDAIEADNMDVHENESGFDLSRDDGVAYIKALAETAHELGLKIGQKNVPDLTSVLVETLDFAITESCYQDDWCEAVTAYVRAGKPVFDAEYTDRPIDFASACEQADSLKLSMILKDRDLTAPRSTCH